jgi:hypothetical protein
MFLNELLTLERPKLTPGHSLQPPTNVERALLVHFPLITHTHASLEHQFGRV